jgi:DNA ligase-associated metallophosphoesterase
LVVSDLHFEKGSFYAARGSLLPPYDTGETLTRLEAVIHATKPKRLIALGDSFHDLLADGRLAAPDRARLHALSRHIATIWIEGNHDPEVPAWLEGQRCHNFAHDGLFFTHIPTGARDGEVAGHLHPCARVKGRTGPSVRRRCFLSDGTRLIMPAFGAFTGGLNVKDMAFDGLFPRPATALVIGGTRHAPTRIRAIAQSSLSPDV